MCAKVNVLCVLNDCMCWFGMYVCAGEVVGRLLRFINIRKRAMMPNVAGGDRKRR